MDPRIRLLSRIADILLTDGTLDCSFDNDADSAELIITDSSAGKPVELAIKHTAVELIDEDGYRATEN